jgi:UDP-glucuronate 4-epimerase
MKILVTGAAGFIGFHLAKRLSLRGDTVVGIDCINDYYQVQLKYHRLAELGFNKDDIIPNVRIQSATLPTCSFMQTKLEDKCSLDKLFDEQQFDIVVNLAAQAGVRYSLTNAQAYIDSNIIGFTNILECSRYHKIKHLVYGSSSSVYGLNESIPFSTAHNVDHPISLYAASKKSNELMAHVYSHLFNVPTTGLRFFTVYGPWGRPDMAYFIFTKSILAGEPIKVFNNGNMARDFTYVDDIVEGVVRVLDHPPGGNAGWSGKSPEPSNSKAPYQIYNIGKNEPVRLMDFIVAIEEELGIKAIKEFHPLQPGDVTTTFADVSELVANLGYKPETTVKTGIKQFIAWYKEYYKM